MVQPQELKAFDKDLGLGAPIFYTFNGVSDEYKYFELNRNTGHIYITAAIPESEFTQPVTLVVQATQFDNPDRYAVTTLTVTRGGIYDSDLQFVQHYYQVTIRLFSSLRAGSKRRRIERAKLQKNEST